MSKSTNRRVQSGRRGTSTPPTASTRPRICKPAGGNRTGAVAAEQPVAGLKGFRSRHPVMSALLPVVLVLVVIGTMVIVKVTGGSTARAQAASRLGAGSRASAGTTALAPAVVAALNVPAAALDNVGSPSSVVAPSRTGTGSILRAPDSKPLVTYIGAEYCPYCAAERWGIAVALSRFGTFSNLSATHSASNDVYPDTQTLSFYGSNYSSPYLDFEPVEEATNQAVGSSYATLQQPTAAQANLLTRYDPQGSIPFLDIGNKYVVIGASYSPQVLAGLSQAQIAAQLANPKSPVAQAIDGTANEITAAITQVTGQQPNSVASSPVIESIARSLGA